METSFFPVQLLAVDQLTAVRKSGDAFSELEETLPTFPPTFKYKVGSFSTWGPVTAAPNVGSAGTGTYQTALCKVGRYLRTYHYRNSRYLR